VNDVYRSLLDEQVLEKQKADKPRVEALSKENETLNTELLAKRDMQMTLLLRSGKQTNPELKL
jgi:hypothetical protein